MAAHFEIDKSSDDQFIFRLKSRNGEIILKSERYTTKQSCEVGIDSVKNNASDDNSYEKETASDGQFYFNLKAKNHEVIGTSEMYTTKQSRDNGIEAVKRDAPDATIEDLTKNTA